MRILGGILLAVGILIATVSGLCSLYFGFAFLMGGPGEFGGIWLVLMVGGIPLLIGIGLIFGGRAILRANPN
jgi:hypothetical protein